MWKTLVVLLLVASLLVADAVDPKKTKKGKKGKKKKPCECLDICFVIDNSGSQRDVFIAQKRFICSFMSTFSFPPDRVRFCAIGFRDTEDRINVLLPFSHVCNDQKDGFTECKQEVTDFPFPNGGTDIKKALDYIYANVFPGGDGDRPDDECPNALIIVTDGSTFPSAESSANNLIAKGVNIFVVALDASVDNADLLQLVGGEQDNVFRQSNLVELPDAVNRLRTKVCDCQGFDPGCQTCCCGELFGDRHKPCPDRKNKCCGKYKWNPRKVQAVCCQGYWFTGYDERWTRCCYDKPYNIKHYTCCYNRIVPATRTQDQCCGFIAFNQKHEICCSGKVYKKEKHTQCCYDVAFNLKWEICCHYIVSEGCTYDYRCCGKRAYNPEHEICCDPYTSYVEESPVKFCGQDIELPCGKGVYDPKWHICCCGWKYDGGVTRKDGCCQHLRYNVHTHLCCDGYLVEADPAWYHCCGRYAFDVWTHTCCHGYFLVEGVGQCCGYYKVFNHKHEICCGDYYVFKGKPHRTKCCYSYYYGYRPYDIKKELCCYGYVQRGGRHWYCCGYYSYNIKTHMCCNGRIYSRKLYRLLGWCEVIPVGKPPKDPYYGYSQDDAADIPTPSDQPLPPPDIESNSTSAP